MLEWSHMQLKFVLKIEIEENRNRNIIISRNEREKLWSEKDEPDIIIIDVHTTSETIRRLAEKNKKQEEENRRRDEEERKREQGQREIMFLN